MREGGKKKLLRKKNIEPIFGPNKKTLDIFLKKLMRATKKTSREIAFAGKIYFIKINLVFFGMFFLLAD